MFYVHLVGIAGLSGRHLEKMFHLSLFWVTQLQSRHVAN